MELIAWIAQYGGWSWVVAGVVLLALELVVPGGVLLWLGVAGIVTGVAALFQPIPGPMQFLIFGILSLAAILLWQRYWRDRVQPSEKPLLNNRGGQLVGHEVILEEPLRNGFGRVPIGDTQWRVSGPDLPAGTRVKVVGHEGAVLKVTAA